MDLGSKPILIVDSASICAAVAFSQKLDWKGKILYILKKELDACALYNPELYRIIIEGVIQTTYIDEYIKIPAQFTHLPLFG